MRPLFLEKKKDFFLSEWETCGGLIGGTNVLISFFLRNIATFRLLKTVEILPLEVNFSCDLEILLEKCCQKGATNIIMMVYARLFAPLLVSVLHLQLVF